MGESRVGVGTVLTLKYDKFELEQSPSGNKGCGMSFSETLKISAIPDYANFTSILNNLKPRRHKHMQTESDREVPSPNYICQKTTDSNCSCRNWSSNFLQRSLQAFELKGNELYLAYLTSYNILKNYSKCSWKHSLRGPVSKMNLLSTKERKKGCKKIPFPP